MSGAVPRKQGNKGSAQVLRLHDVVSRFRTFWDSAEHPGRNHTDHSRISKASFKALLDHSQISDPNKTSEITFCLIDKRGTRRNHCSLMPGQPTSCFLLLPQKMCSCLYLPVIHLGFGTLASFLLSRLSMGFSAPFAFNLLDFSCSESLYPPITYFTLPCFVF